MLCTLFIDTTFPIPYDFDTLSNQAMGGTESSILRTALILSQQKHQVFILQHSRQQKLTQKGISFLGPEQSQEVTPTHVIILRKWPALKTYQKHYPLAQFYLWLHTYKKPEFALKRLFNLPKSVTLIGNSATHQQHLDDCLHYHFIGRFLSMVGIKKIKITFAYNPIPRFWTTLRVNAKNNHQLIFISAPNKGLSQVLDYFKTIKEQLPDMTLLVANPGYREDKQMNMEGVVWLGALPQKELLEKVAKSLCVFYPQTTFAETFGLIYAEANAVGTAVLAHNIGSAKEILHPNNPLIDGHDIDAIITQLKQWLDQLPEVAYRDIFDDQSIARQWHSIFGLEINR